MTQKPAVQVMMYQAGQTLRCLRTFLPSTQGLNACLQRTAAPAWCRTTATERKHAAAHLAGQRGQDVALEDVEEARGDLGADRQDLVQVQQLRAEGKRSSFCRAQGRTHATCSSERKR